MKLYLEQSWYHVLCPHCVWQLKYSAFSHAAFQPGHAYPLKYSEHTSEQYLMKSSMCLCGSGELSAFIATKGISHHRALS